MTYCIQYTYMGKRNVAYTRQADAALAVAETIANCQDVNRQCVDLTIVKVDSGKVERLMDQFI